MEVRVVVRCAVMYELGEGYREVEIYHDLAEAVNELHRKVGAEIVVITSFPDSPIGKAADLIIELGGRVVRPGKEDYFASQILGIHEPLMPMGTLFEDSCMILLDAIIADLMQRMGKTEEEMRMRHANIE